MVLIFRFFIERALRPLDSTHEFDMLRSSRLGSQTVDNLIVALNLESKFLAQLWDFLWTWFWFKSSALQNP